jgi:cytochrome c oxidase assembly factor CtaG
MESSLSTYPGLGWNWETSILLGLGLVSGVYWLVAGPGSQRLAPRAVPGMWRKIAFHTGTGLVFLALISPLDRLADEYLFSAHMIQHLLLIYFAPPLWLLGLPTWIPEWITRRRVGQQVFAWLTQPVVAFLVFNGTMWAWHLPSAYDAALAQEGLHIVEHLTFLASAVVGWWPIVGPIPKGSIRLSPLTRSVYLFLSMLACTSLAALITLSPRRLYFFYGDNPWSWGLSPLLDQQLGGLLMWLPTDMLLMTTTLVILYSWIKGPVSRKTTRESLIQEMEA